MPTMKHALVISGGGSKGAFAGGIAQYLIEEEKINYEDKYELLFYRSIGYLILFIMPC